jgi:hypothetical protein
MSGRMLRSQIIDRPVFIDPPGNNERALGARVISRVVPSQSSSPNDVGDSACAPNTREMLMYFTERDKMDKNNMLIARFDNYKDVVNVVKLSHIALRMEAAREIRQRINRVMMLCAILTSIITME